MGKKNKKAAKVSEQDRASVAASSFNAAALIVSGAVSKATLEGAAEATLDLAEEFFIARIEWMEINKVGNAPKSGGGGGNSGRSGGSSRSSGGSNGSKGPTPKMAGFYGDLIDAIKEAGGKAEYKIDKFKDLGYEAASAAIDDAIETRDNLA